MKEISKKVIFTKDILPLSINLGWLKYHSDITQTIEYIIAHLKVLLVPCFSFERKDLSIFPNVILLFMIQNVF